MATSSINLYMTPPSSEPTSDVSTPVGKPDGKNFYTVSAELLTNRLSSIDLDTVRDVLVSIAHTAGDMIRAAQSSVFTSDSKKNSADRVTETDKAVEQMVKSRLSVAYPSFDFLGEETSKAGQTLSEAPTFICDPIDGTLNFIHSFPNTAVSLALTVARRPVVGVVFNPFRRDLYTAVRGSGAYLEDASGCVRRLPLNPTPPALLGLSGSLVAVEWGSERYGPNWRLRNHTVTKLLTHPCEGGAMVHSIRSSGSAALDFCYVAAGQLDAFWEGGCWAWDVAAGWVILTESGGLVAGSNDGEWNPEVDGRSYFAVRAAPNTEGQIDLVRGIWACMDGNTFTFK